MADTSFATGDSSTVKLWSRRWWVAAKEKSFFYANGFVGAGDDNIIVEMPDLMKDKGDRIRKHQYQNLSGSGITGENTLEGHEEALSQYYFDVTIDQIRHAIRLGGSVSEQRHGDNGVRQQMKDALSLWLADYIDGEIFTGLTTSITKAVYGGDATATTDIEAGDYMTLNLISKAVAKAGKGDPVINPVSQGGDRLYAMILSHDSAYDLTEQNSRWEQAQKDAGTRGSENKLWTRSLGIWKDTAVFRHANVPIATDWGGGGTITGSTNLFLGAGAGAIAYAKKKKWVEKLFDYDDKYGLAVGSIHGFAKATFNSSDNAVIGVLTSRTSQ